MNKSSVYRRIILFTALSNWSTNIVHPVTPTFLLELGMPDYMFGVLFAAMAFGMMLLSPLLGRIADRRGRVPVFLAGNLGYALSQSLFFFCGNPVAIIVARFMGGATGAAMTISNMAAIIDLSREEERASRLSAYAATVCVSSSLGYFTGGMLGARSTAHAFIFQIVLLLLLTAFSFRFLPETLNETVAAERADAKKRTWREMRSAVTPLLFVFLLCAALANLATYGFDNAFNYFIKRELGFSSAYNGIIKAANGLLGLWATLYLNRLLLRRLPADRALTLTLWLCALTLSLVTVTRSVPLFIAFSVIFYIFNAMYQPLLQSLMTRAGHFDFGLLSGLFNSARSVGMIIGSLAAGWLYLVSPRAPFLMEALCLALSALCAVALTRMLAKA